MNVVDRPGCPPLSPQEGWLSDGRQVLPFLPLRYSRWSQALEVTMGELTPAGEPPLLQAQPSAKRQRRKELTREQAIKLWTEKRQAGWQPCAPQWSQPPAGGRRW